jgi:hypothetical protein
MKEMNSKAVTSGLAYNNATGIRGRERFNRICIFFCLNAVLVDMDISYNI